MIALVLMRLRGYALSGRVVPPLLAGVVVIGVIYGGGPAPAGEAYGFSAMVLMPVLAWQTKMLLDSEPDVQRRLARVVLGSANAEALSGLLAAVVAAVAVVVLALVGPWLLGGITGPAKAGDPSLGTGIGLGIWAHLVMLLPSVAMGAIASRAVTVTAGRGVSVLGGAVVATLVFGLSSSPAPWLVPPALAVTKRASAAFDLAGVSVVTCWALLWTAVATGGYLLVRQVRS